jgi:signal transduction histidine kinase
VPIRSLTIAAVLAAAAATVVGSAVAGVHLGLHTAGAHIAIDSATAVIAVLAAYLVFARFARGAGLADLLLVAALIVAAVGAVAFGAIPAAVHPGVSRFMTWSSATVALVASILFALAGWVAPRRVSDVRAATASLCGFCIGALTLIALVFALLSPHLALGLDPSLSPNAPGRVVGNSALLAIMLTIAGLYAAAAVGFMRRSVAQGDELFGWFSLSTALLAFAALNWFLFPSRYSGWLFVGDWLRLAAYVVLLAAAAREIAAYQRGIAAAATLEERRRLARELHDGLAQELAFISTQTRRLLGQPADTRRLEQLALAAERALDESRSAIRALTRRLDEPLEVALAQAAEEVADRVGIAVRLDLGPAVQVPVTTREALLRIVREAVSNTARHSRASQVTVTLRGGEPIRLVIVDDGVGFDPGAEDDGGLGFGLVSMRERAHAFGGELEIESRPGEGTRIEVVIP